MQVDITKIVEEKLNQMERDGIIQKKIEDALEKSVLDAVTSSSGGYQFKRKIEEQLESDISYIAKNCGLSTYNAFIAEKAAEIVQNMYTSDIAQKVQDALNKTLVAQYKDIKLSDIFERYRTWVKEHTEESEQYEYERFTCELEENEDGHWTTFICRFSDHPIERTSYYKERPEIEIRILSYGGKKQAKLSSVFLNNHNLKDTVKVGTLTDFEAFIVNLYYNETEIELDVDNVDQDNTFDIDI